MARNPESSEAPRQQVLLVDFAAQARQQFLEDMNEFRKNPIDRSVRRGGYFLNADGSGAHDANGNPVKVREGDEEAVAELKRAATFNRAGTGLGKESADVETTSMADAMAGTISRPAFSAVDTNVRVAKEEVGEPQSLDEIAAEIDERHAALEEASGGEEADRLPTAEEAAAAEEGNGGEDKPKKKRRR